MSTVKFALVCADDDPIVLQMLGFQLEKIIDPKVTICEFFTSPEQVLPGIDQLKEQGIETLFLIVDYQMPKMSGADLIRQVKGKYPQIKCLMLSGQANAIHVDALAGVSVTVENTGPEIPQEIIGQIFRKFFTTKHQKSGTGLGLSIVKNVADEHGATVSVRSENGRTAFTVTFPNSDPTS